MPRLLTARDVADVLRIHEKTVKRMLRTGAQDGRKVNPEHLHGFKIGGKGPWKVRQAELDRFIALHEVNGIEE
ncbi:helix-turn-helix domain-containing protein [Pseudodesulfovibrio pelocollis]|uniref:helix-turn-helix domain-containing protein n=1 Tax=Pseudodesulfovibrio pelocollis TaxID=3051432 RepID=UPI00255B3466|nr:helix-turn-helix domain-containing protein [Pseudodesulfovibrio sp. SB368]